MSVREIRFRAWTGKEMRFPPALGEWDFEDCDLFAGYNKKPTVLMQYTGLHDKNGREIYEGDIVRLVTGEVKEIRFYDDLGYDQSFGKASGFYIDHELEYYDAGPQEWEVIGNICENPELIQEAVKHA